MKSKYTQTDNFDNLTLPISTSQAKGLLMQLTRQELAELVASVIHQSSSSIEVSGVEIHQLFEEIIQRVASKHEAKNKAPEAKNLTVSDELLSLLSGMG